MQISGGAKDAWGKRAKDIELKGNFKFDFHFADIQKIAKNKKEAETLIKSTAFKLDKMPEIFSTQIVANDPKLTRAKIAAILKRDMPGRKEKLSPEESRSKEKSTLRSKRIEPG